MSDVHAAEKDDLMIDRLLKLPLISAALVLPHSKASPFSFCLVLSLYSPTQHYLVLSPPCF